MPIVNIVGQHATYHLQYDAPLTSDIEGIARPYSRWLRTSQSSAEVGLDAVQAMVAARTAPGQIATLIVGKGWPLYELSGVNLSLEDIFLELTTEEAAHAESAN